MGAGNNTAGVMYKNGTNSLGTVSSTIHTDHFCGKDSPVNVILRPTPYTSMIDPPSFGFKTHVGCKLNEQDRAKNFVYEPKIKIGVRDGEHYAELLTGSNRVKFHASGLFDNGKFSSVYEPHMEDLRIEEWRKVCRDDNAVSYSTPEKEINWMVQSPKKVADFGPDTPLHKCIIPTTYSGPSGKYGTALSMLQNRIQDVRNILFDSEHRIHDRDTVDYGEFLTSEYDTDPRTVLAIGIENLGPLYSARLYYDDKHSTLVFDTKFYDYAKAKAKALGLCGREELEYIIRVATYHELDHNAQPHTPEREAEIRTGENLSKFFLEKANGLEGTRRGKIYKLLSEDAKKYAELYRKGGVESRSKSRNLESKIEALEAEARSLDLSDDEAIDYVTRNLEEEVNQYDSENKERELGKADKGYRKADEGDCSNQNGEEDIDGNPEATDDGEG